SNSTFVSLGSPVIVTNLLNLKSGVITPTSSNTLSVTNTATSAISGGASSSYINGPVNWTLLSSGTNSYVFPVGMATCPSTNAYLPFTLSSKNTTSGNVATVQAFSANSGGTPDGTSVTYLDSAVYWSLSTSASLTTTGSTVSIAQPTAISPYNVI